MSTGDGELETFAGEKALDVQGIFYLVHYHMPGKLVINPPPVKLTCPLKKRPFEKKISSSNHQFEGIC